VRAASVNALIRVPKFPKPGMGALSQDPPPFLTFGPKNRLQPFLEIQVII